eukprot:15462559-Alexandrium_andersonii.AAC.1
MARVPNWGSANFTAGVKGERAARGWPDTGRAMVYGCCAKAFYGRPNRPGPAQATQSDQGCVATDR